MKTCRVKDCTEINPQPLSNFVKDERYKDGYQNRCKSCQKKYDAQRFLENREKLLHQSKTYYAENIEAARAARALWRAMNKHIVRECHRRWRENNPGRANAKTRKYQLAKKNRCPKWLTVEQIQAMTEIYETCPEGYEVDHIIPLQGKNVSGLHVPWNLQHLPIPVNRSKSNKY